MTAAIYSEWAAIIARRKHCNASGQDGRDFHLWLKHRGLTSELVQLELF